MPRKGMRSICFNPKTPSFSIYHDSNSSSSPARSSLSTPRRSFSESMMDQVIEAATVMIMKWNPDSSTFARVTSLFYEDKREAIQFIKCVNDLQKAMHLLVSDNSASGRLVHAQNLMQIAMKRLQKEFYQILSMNRAHLDPESVSARSSRTSARSSTSDFDDDGSVSRDDDEVRVVGNTISEVERVSSIAMADLKSIADCMISSGYTKECINIYKVIRKSIIDEGIYRLGVERTSSSHFRKMDWEMLDFKIKNWSEAVKISIRTLFNGERILCDHVFSYSDFIRESCFVDISQEGATLLFGFPELVAKSKIKSPDKIFRILEMYTAIANHWPEIESIFSFESTSTVRSQALHSLVKLSESVRAMISDFETSIQKDSSKVIIPGGGVHPLTIQVVNYLCNLADYSSILGDILADWAPQTRSSLPKLYFDSPSTSDSPTPPITLHVAWLILVLLCKLDGKAEMYKDVSLSYLFLANNLHHVVSKVRTSNLQYLIGEDWISKHEAKVRQFATKYENLVWGPVYQSLPGNPTATITPGQAKDFFKSFNSSFEEVYKKQSTCIVPDQKLRDHIKVSITRKLVAVYREFYDKHRSILGGERNERIFIRYAPEDLGNYLSDLFLGTGDSVSSVSSSTSSYHRRRSWLRG